jgi:hypothetical protein
VAGPVALAALALQNAWETGAKDILRGRGKREDWINQGANMAFGFVPNLALRMLGKPSIGKMMTTGKSEPQLIRDEFRKDLRAEGIINKDYTITLADGSNFALKDGKTKYVNLDGSKRNAWDVDLNNPLHQAAIAQIDPIIGQRYGDAKSKKIHPEQFTGILVNAVTSNAKTPEEVAANINAMFGKSKLLNQPPSAPANQQAPMPAPAPLQNRPAPQPNFREEIKKRLG